MSLADLAYRILNGKHDMLIKGVWWILGIGRNEWHSLEPRMQLKWLSEQVRLVWQLQSAAQGH